jgi:hypothetical protein
MFSSLGHLGGSVPSSLVVPMYNNIHVCLVNNYLSFCTFSFGHCVVSFLNFRLSDYLFDIKNCWPFHCLSFHLLFSLKCSIMSHYVFDTCVTYAPIKKIPDILHMYDMLVTNVLTQAINVQETFEDPKGVIRSRKSNDRQ